MKKNQIQTKPQKISSSYLHNRFSQNGIYVLGAKEHNLKNINVFIPRNKITVITGLSGSGKSTLAFDTIYGEGQRRYLESVSHYARYFIDQMKRPEVDLIYGLSPSIAIHQKTISHNPRSTVGTTTEIYDYLRLFYSHLGEVFCPTHNVLLQSQTAEQILSDIEKSFLGEDIFIYSPIARGKKGEFMKEIDYALSLGFDQAQINGETKDLGQVHKLNKRKEHYIDILIDRLKYQKTDKKRLQEAIDRALLLSDGYLKVTSKKEVTKDYSLRFSCPKCDYNFLDRDSKIFSFNSPKGACLSCNGTGLSYFYGNFEEENLNAGEDPELLDACADCKGQRLKPSSLQVKIQGKSIAELSNLPTEEMEIFIKSLKWKGVQKEIAKKITEPILHQLSFFKQLSLSYLSLNRSLSTLSGGEAQRVRLVSQLSSPIIGVLYVLDEPSIGLHPKDHKKILEVLETIRRRGNTILMVEHDEESILCADKIIDLGPGAGILGGEVIAEGSLSEIKKNKKSLTGAYLSGRAKIPSYKSVYTGKEKCLELKGASHNNLKNIDVKIPLGLFVGVSGVSGSGKSSLVNATIYPRLFNHIYQSDKPEGPCKLVKGLDFIERVIQINQKPIGRSSRSNPATYVGVLPMIRALFSQLPESRMRSYNPGYFSFNVKNGGRCEHCMGLGSIKLEMKFLADVFSPCEYCKSQRYHSETLQILYRDKNIYDILNMSISEAVVFFKNHSIIHHRLKFLEDVGLGYLTLGQSSTTLSGGEAQRVKLSRELSKKTKGHTFYTLDEPTTGLHFEDIKRLISVLKRLVEQGNTVLVIEHHLDVLKSCDYLIDLGPEGGKKGGFIAAQGSPKSLINNKKSQTAGYLKKYFE